MNTLRSLLRSRKVVLALLGVIQTLACSYLGLPADVWLTINALLVAVIGSIALEDAALKRGGGRHEP